MILPASSALPSRARAIMTLTKGPLNVVSEPDRPARETDAEDAIGITKEMIKAGILALLKCDSRIEGPQGVVVGVWEAMEKVAKRQ